MTMTLRQSEALAAIATARKGELPKIHGMTASVLRKTGLIEGDSATGFCLTEKGRAIVQKAQDLERRVPVDPLRNVTQIQRQASTKQPKSRRPAERPPRVEQDRVSYFDDLREQIEARYEADLEALDRVIQISKAILADKEA